MPLGIASIAAYLRKEGIPVCIIDAQAEELTIEDVQKRICEIKPDIVGITSMTPTVHDDITIAKASKQLGIKVVFGGPQVNAMPLETIQLKPIDFAILGEGEYPMFKLVEALSNNLPLRDVPGIIYQERDGSIVRNQPYIHTDIDMLPVPARDFLPFDRYYSVISRGRLATICSGRGCPFKCAFCFKQPSDKIVRLRNPKLVVDEMEEVIQNQGIKVINFVTDTLTVNVCLQKVSDKSGNKI